MAHSFDATRRASALALACLVTALGAAVPLLDRGAGHELPAFEPEGARATCVLGHDHGICTQYGANPLAPAAALLSARPLPVRRAAPASGDILAASGPYFTLRRSRAPPAA